MYGYHKVVDIMTCFLYNNVRVSFREKGDKEDIRDEMPILWS